MEVPAPPQALGTPRGDCANSSSWAPTGNGVWWEFCLFFPLPLGLSGLYVGNTEEGGVG